MSLSFGISIHFAPSILTPFFTNIWVQKKIYHLFLLSARNLHFFFGVFLHFFTSADNIVEIFNKSNGRYDYRRITDKLEKIGYAINHKTADNILKRDFTSDEPFEKLATDVTEFKVYDDKVYLSPVLDLFNREIVSIP